jgi:mono/diheme cytochrome c family protein
VTTDFLPGRLRDRPRWGLTGALVAISLAVVAACGLVVPTLLGGHRDAAHFANADDGPTVLLGKRVYRERCAACRGRYLQGQPLWQMHDALSHQRAPAHDQTGHTWLHSDEALFFTTKYGHFADAAATAVSAMPAFKDVLDDREIVAVIAFIKARWPVGLLVAQAALNPGQAGMPAGAAASNWTFPPDCVAATRRVVVRSKPRG